MQTALDTKYQFIIEKEKIVEGEAQLFTED